MNRNPFGLIFTAGIILAATGCNLVLRQGLTGDQTIAALADAALQQTAVEKTLNAPKKSEAAPLPTATATLQPTPTYTPSITLTSTREKVTVTVSKNTNCRTGPDKFFDLVGIMKVGETAEAIGRNKEKTYWVINLPSKPGETCWLWYEWATLTGNGDALPIIESPPTPTWSPKPDFSFSYVGLATCVAPKIIRLQIVNTGNMPWESFRVHTMDTVTSAEMNFSSDQFMDASDPTCLGVAHIQAIGPGETAYAIGLVMDPATHGHNISVDLHLYTQNLGTGTHMSGNFNFTMP